MGLLGHRLGRVVQEVGVRALAAATDAATQLMELAQAETVGMVDDQRVRIGDIKTGLDDCGTHEHVDVAMPEVADDLVELLLPHLAVAMPTCASGTSVWILSAMDEMSCTRLWT